MKIDIEKTHVNWENMSTPLSSRINALLQTAPDHHLLLKAIEKELASHNKPTLGLNPVLVPWLPDRAKSVLLATHFVDAPGAWRFAGVEDQHYENLVKFGNASSASLNQSLANDQACPLTLLEILAKNKNSSVRKNVAGNPNCPLSLLEVLARDKDCQVRSGIAGNTNCLARLLEILAKDGDREVRKNVAANSNCPVSLLEILAKDRNNEVKQYVAGNPNCPLSLLEVLATDKDCQVRSGIAGNTNCPVSLLEGLAKDGDREVRKNVAANSNCPVSLLEVLAKDRNEVKRYVAGNPGCLASLLEAMSNNLHTEDSILESIAYSPNCTLELLETLPELYLLECNEFLESVRGPDYKLPSSLAEYGSKKADLWAMQIFAGNPNCPLSLLEYLVSDEDSWVRQYVAANPNNPLTFLGLGDDFYVENIKKLSFEEIKFCVVSVRCPISLLEFLSNDVPKRVCEDPNRQKSLLLKLSKSDLAIVRTGVANQTGTPIEVLVTLLSDKNLAVRRYAAANLYRPERDEAVQLLESAARENRSIMMAVLAPRRPLTLEDCIYSNCPPKLKLLAALQPDCPNETLFKSTNSRDPLERLAAALNPNLASTDVMRLLDDSDENVQRAAARHRHCVHEIHGSDCGR